MVQRDELRIGNRVFWKPQLSYTNVLLQVEITAVLPDKVSYVPSHLEHRVEPFEDDLITKENSYASFDELVAIPLKDDSVKLNSKIKYPKWIQYLHELQNWYYWENNKKELETD